LSRITLISSMSHSPLAFQLCSFCEILTALTATRRSLVSSYHLELLYVNHAGESRCAIINNVVIPGLVYNVPGSPPPSAALSGCGILILLRGEKESEKQDDGAVTA